MKPPAAAPEPRRILTVGNIQYDESRAELTVDGARRAIEAKPLALLHALLTRAGAIASKRELIEAVWGNADHISEASLTTAMSKLRAALGETGREIIDVVHGSGYRITQPVEVTAARETPRLAFTFQPGDAVPGRPQWRLERVIGAAPLNDVWLARHQKTAEQRVFKFADSESRLDTLKREATLSRVLQATLGQRDDIVRILEWNFDNPPCFIESAYGGIDLPAWAETQGGLPAVPLQKRLDLLAQVAASIAAAHGAGVIHSDIKPANILIGENPAEPAAPVRPRLVDFGAGGLNDVIRLDALAISLHGLHDADGARGSGTLRYMAPEVLAGGVPTTRADIYALGILLYQLVAGDLSKSLTVGWEADIADPLLREDIAIAAAGDPERRLDSASAFAERLTSLPARREALQARRRAEAEAAALARQVEQERLRRPWVIAAAASLAAGIALSTWFGVSALHERDEARRRADIAQAVNSFLTEDLFGRGNPAQSGKAEETLMEAAQAAEAGINRRLASEPFIAGSIYLSLARAFDSRSEYDAARNAYDQAIAAFGRAGSHGVADAAIARLHEAAMEVVSGQPGSMNRAKSIVAAVQPTLPRLGLRQAEAQVWLNNAQGAVEMLGGDVHAAVADYRQAADRADTMPEVFEESTRLTLRTNLAFAYMRLNDWDNAAPMISALLQRRLALNGPHHPATLRLDLDLAQIRIAQGHAAEALPELNRIYPDFVAVYGPDHLQTLLLLSTRGEALDRLERFQEAAVDQLAVQKMFAAKHGDHSFVALGALADAAHSECRAGQVAQGLAAANSVHDAAAASFGAHSILVQIAAMEMAFCDTLAGNPQAAAPLLQNIDCAAVDQFEMGTSCGARLDLMHAAIALHSGNPPAAGPLLDQAVRVFDRDGGDKYLQRLAHRLQAERMAAAKN
jgi:serine/threonine protein kinase/DNA-binding winged helix-turn-helix (wHTH) protein